jgi:DNA-binding GntR family transcriptional regulator
VVEPYLRLYVSTAGSFRAAQQQHRAILDSLKKGDEDRAVATLRRHLSETEEIVGQGINSASADED